MAKNTAKASLKAVKAPLFNPQATYGWQHEDQFTISGTDLDTLNKALTVLIQDPAIQKAMATVEAQKVIATLIQANVENGKIREVTPEAIS